MSSVNHDEPDLGILNIITDTSLSSKLVLLKEFGIMKNVIHRAKNMAANSNNLAPKCAMMGQLLASIYEMPAN